MSCKHCEPPKPLTAQEITTLRDQMKQRLAVVDLDKLEIKRSGNGFLASSFDNYEYFAIAFDAVVEKAVQS